MDYHHFSTRLIKDGFYRIARDDRLLDIFPDQTTEKGIELWEQHSPDTTTIIRIHEPQNLQSVTTHQIPNSDLEQALLQNKTLNLEDYTTVMPADLKQIKDLSGKDNIAD